MRAVRRRVCSSWLTSSQYLSRITPGVDDGLLDEGHELEKPCRLLLGAKPHDRLDAGPVVPAPIEDHDLTAGGEVRHVALEVHLRAFTLVRGGQCHDPKDAGADPLGEPLDDAALARGVPALEDDAHLGVLLDDPALQVHELDLQAPELLLVFFASHLGHLPARDRRSSGALRASMQGGRWPSYSRMPPQYRQREQSTPSRTCAVTRGDLRHDPSMAIGGVRRPKTSAPRRRRLRAPSGPP